MNHQSKRHVLTVGLEDYFQVGSFNQLIQRGQWYRFQTRLEHNTEAGLNLLEEFGVKATFFVLGWIADEYPELVRQVAERGHEIASKGYYHRSIRQMSPSEFREDLARSREALERAGRRKVLGYRVAHEWFSPSDLWALDILAEEGYVYDSSIAPIFRRFAREPYRRFMHKHVSGARQLLEFPLSSWSVLGWHVPIAGGNYFRQFPHRILKHAVDHWHRKLDAPFVMYFHVWELDPDQPHINAASLLTRIRHYRNLGKMSWVLRDYLKKYCFTSVADYLGLDLTLEQAQLEILASVRPPKFPSDSARKLEAVSAQHGGTGRLPVTLVIPCYNEELVLPYLANTLASFQSLVGGDYDLHFIFVDDCSKDGTWTALRQIFGAKPNCVVLRHERNKGAASAILTGLRNASTEVICSIDCDCSYDPHELRNMIPMLTAGVDVVTASPYHPQGGVRNVPPWRLSLSKGASFLYRRILRQKLCTYTSFFRVYRRNAVVGLDLREGGFLGVAEMLAVLDLQGSTVVEYPTVLEGRMLGRSKMKILKTILGHIRLLGRFLVLRVRGQKKSPTAAVRDQVEGSARETIPTATVPDSKPH